jgi:ribosomal protein L32E
MSGLPFLLMVLGTEKPTFRRKASDRLSFLRFCPFNWSKTEGDKRNGGSSESSVSRETVNESLAICRLKYFEETVTRLILPVAYACLKD